MASPHYFPFYPNFWRSPRVRKLSPENKAIYIDLLCDIFASDLKLEDDDELVAYALQVSMPQWLVAKAELSKGTDPLIYVCDGFLVSRKLCDAHANAVATTIARQEGAAITAEIKRNKRDK